MQPVTREEHYLAKLTGVVPNVYADGDTVNERYDLVPDPLEDPDTFSGNDVKVPKPVTRLEKYEAKLTGDYAGELPDPVIQEEYYWANLCAAGDSVPDPITRIDLYLSKACGKNVKTPVPVTRKEKYLAEIVKLSGSYTETRHSCNMCNLGYWFDPFEGPDENMFPPEFWEKIGYKPDFESKNDSVMVIPAIGLVFGDLIIRDYAIQNKRQILFQGKIQGEIKAGSSAYLILDGLYEADDDFGFYLPIARDSDETQIKGTNLTAQLIKEVGLILKNKGTTDVEFDFIPFTLSVFSTKF